MALVSMRELLDHAAEQGYGIPAFNVNNLEQVQAVMAAAHETGAPVILQASAGARKYAGESFIKHLIQAAVEAYRQRQRELAMRERAHLLGHAVFLDDRDCGKRATRRVQAASGRAVELPAVQGTLETRSLVEHRAALVRADV